MATGEWVYNFPAGLIDAGEEPQQSAKRELWEETVLNCTELMILSIQATAQLDSAMRQMCVW